MNEEYFDYKLKSLEKKIDSLQSILSRLIISIMPTPAVSMPLSSWEVDISKMDNWISPSAVTDLSFNFDSYEPAEHILLFVDEKLLNKEQYTFNGSTSLINVTIYHTIPNDGTSGNPHHFTMIKFFKKTVNLPTPNSVLNDLNFEMINLTSQPQNIPENNGRVGALEL